MKDINEVFSELDSRIDELKELRLNLNANNFVRRQYNLNSIERNIFRFKGEAIQRISVSLNELNQLNDLGISVISEKAFTYDDYFQEQLTDAEQLKKAEEQRKYYYQILKGEIEFYINRLTEIQNEIDSESDIGKNRELVLKIEGELNLPRLKLDRPELGELILNKDQVGILVQYLKDTKVILPYDAKSLSKIVSILTAYSENTLRNEVFREINTLKDEVVHSTKNSVKPVTNLQVVHEYLMTLISTINSDLKKASSK